MAARTNRDYYSPFKNTTNVEKPFIEIETHFDERKFRGRARQGWELIECFWNPATNSKGDNGFPVYIIGRTAASKDAATKVREANKAAKKGAKKSNKKSTAKKRK